MSDRLAEIRHRLEAHVYPDVMEPEIRFLLARLAACEQERDEAKAASEEHVAVAMEAVADADKAEARLAAAEQTCPLCGHEWRRHDPEDGKCDAGGDRHCGRDLAWMQQRIAALSRAYLAANTEPG